MAPMVVFAFFTLLALLPVSTFGSRSGPATTTAVAALQHHGHAGHGPKHSTSPAAVAALVRSTCNSTAYYDVCVSALGADPSSATADVRGLSTIAVSAATANASGGAATAAALAATNVNGTTAAAAASSSNNPATAALLRTCADKYGQARDALGAAGESIGQQDFDFAAMHVSAAAEYPQVCRALFRRLARTAQYPAELAAREEALRQLCSVALDIIALASNSNSNSNTSG